MKHDRYREPDPIPDDPMGDDGINLFFLRYKDPVTCQWCKVRCSRIEFNSCHSEIKCNAKNKIISMALRALKGGT